MRTLLVAGIAMGSLTFLASIAKSQIRNQGNDSCLNARVAEIIAEKSDVFKGPQIGIVCGISKLDVTETQCEREEKDKTFTYHAPTGFQIIFSEFQVQTKSKYSTVGDVRFGEDFATVTLQCIGRPCDIPGHELVRGNIVGQLQYQLSQDEMMVVKNDCHGGRSQ